MNWNKEFHNLSDREKTMFTSFVAGYITVAVDEAKRRDEESIDVAQVEHAFKSALKLAKK